MPQNENELLRAMAQRIMAQDEEVATQARAMQPMPAADAQEVQEALPAGAPPPPTVLETIVVREGRPVLLVSNDNYIVDGPEAAVWRQRLTATDVRSTLQSIIPAVGRVEVENHPTMSWIGTGWLVDDDVIVTNRHVADKFGTQGANGFIFRRGNTIAPSRMAARIDFREERDTTEPNEFQVLDILHIEDDEGPDIAFLKVADTSAAGLRLAGKIRLADERPEANQFVATIGYPAADSRVPDQPLVHRIFGDVYNVKRMAPGQLLDPRDDLILHDCSTLGGNSGSPIVDLHTGTAVGLHFSGLFLQENRGVSAAVVRDRLEKLRRGSLHPMPRVETQPVVTTRQSGPAGSEQTIRLDVTIPIEITVRVGGAVVGASGPPPGERLVESAVDQARAQFDLASLRRDGFSWTSALAMATASQLAYHVEPTVRPMVIDRWGCDSCDLFSTEDTDGFVAGGADAAFVAFRGTSSTPDWLRNLDLAGVNRPYGRIHGGFFKAFDIVQAEVRRSLDRMNAAGKKIWLTGHSLGGALATVAAAELADSYTIAGIYTYGMPRVGNRAFQEFFATRYAGKLYRFVNNRDIVPRVPPTYRHVGQLFFFDGQGRYAADVTESIGLADGPEPEPLTEEEFEQLQADLTRNQGQTESLPPTNGMRGDTVAEQPVLDESLEGIFPSVSDHAIARYISLIQRQVQNA